MSKPRALVSLLHLPMFDSPGQGPFTVSSMGWKSVKRAFGLVNRFKGPGEEGFLAIEDRKAQAVRVRALGYAPFVQSVWSENFGISPQRWVGDMEEAFGLEEPPSPYEAGMVILGDLTLFRTLPGKPEVKGALCWYLGGLNTEVLDVLVPGWEEGGAELLRGMMGNSWFAMWALGTDMTPVITTRAKARALLYRDKGLRVPRRKLRESAYVSSQLTLGKRAAPVERPLLHTGTPPVWSSYEERVGLRTLWDKKMLANFRTKAQDILGEGFEIEPLRAEHLYNQAEDEQCLTNATTI